MHPERPGATGSDAEHRADVARRREFCRQDRIIAKQVLSSEKGRRALRSIAVNSDFLCNNLPIGELNTFVKIVDRQASGAAACVKRTEE